MPRTVIALVDGFNLYHAINDHASHSSKWVDIISLLRAFVQNDEQLKKAFFFTSVSPWSQEKAARQDALLTVYKDQSVNIVYGSFKKKEVRCLSQCKESFEIYEEKETDVNIALHLAKIAREKLSDKVILLTGDSDQSPAVRYAKEVNEQLIIKAVIPPHRNCNELKGACDQNASISLNHLTRHRLPDDYLCKDGSKIKCPFKWRTAP